MSSKASGFTIVEVLLALAVTAIAVVIMGYLGGSMRDLRIAQNQTAALNFARNYLDTTRALWSQKSSSTTNNVTTITTQYVAAYLPGVTAPSGLQYAVTAAELSGGSAGQGVMSCPKASVCVGVPGAGDVNAPQRRVTITVTDADNRNTVLSMNITRVDIP